MRHGHSTANADAIITSDPMVCKTAYGLSRKGKAQVTASSRCFPAEFDEGTLIVSSDFLRARQTAEIVAAQLDTSRPIRFSQRLRERCFGLWEGKSDRHYETVWASDLADPSHDESGVEPATEVRNRAMALVKALESEYSDTSILLVAHGDVLQLLQTAFEQQSPALHRQLKPLEAAEIRALIPSPHIV